MKNYIAGPGEQLEVLRVQSLELPFLSQYIQPQLPQPYVYTVSRFYCGNDLQQHFKLCFYINCELGINIPFLQKEEKIEGWR